MYERLKPGIDELTWTSKGVDIWLEDVGDIVGAVTKVVDGIKNNMKTACNILSKWWSKPMVERRLKPVVPEEFEATHKNNVGLKLQQMSEDGKEIHKLVQDSADTLKLSRSECECNCCI
eukprot:GHVU01138267.1.p1 GENE.GHVU01138267.1~~GHVU01138267.1.p1  ORF type:complete len:119 (+),score=23.74 GHVU01138267.1:121-477(+)